MATVNSKRIAKNTAMLYIRMAVSIVISLYTSRIVLNALGFVDFGVYNVVGGIVVVFTSVTASLSGATARFITLELSKEKDSEPQNVFSTAAVLHILLAGVIIILSEAIGVWFLNTHLEIPESRLGAANWVLQFSIVAAAISFTQVPYTAAMVAHERMSIFAYVGLFSSFANLGIAFLIAHNPIDRLIWYGALILLVNVLSLLISRIYCLRHFPETHIRRPKNRKLFKEMLAFGGYDLIGNISVLAQGQGLNIVLNMFYGPVLNAARAIAFRIQSVAQQFISSFTTALRPQVYRLYANGQIPELMHMVMRGALMTFLLMLMLVIPVSVNLPFILKIWLGEYPDYTVPFTILVLVNSLFSSFGTTRLMVFHASGQIKAYSLTSGAIMTLALPLGYLLLRLGYPPISIFYGMLATTIMSDINCLLLLRRYVRYSVIEFIRKVYAHCFFCTALALGGSLVVRHYSIAGNEILTVVYTTLIAEFIIGLYAWRFGLTQSQRKSVLRKLKIKNKE